jgi:TatD DNase family protein
MNLIDTHCHLYSKDFNADRPAAIQRARDAGLSAIYLPNVDLDTIPGMLDLEVSEPGFCIPMMGLHPCHVGEDFVSVLDNMEAWLKKRPFVAIGEIGLDLYWDKTFAAQQEVAFHRQMSWATQYDIPIVIHSREATDRCIELVAEHRVDGIRGVFHCFGGTVEQAEKIRDLGFYLGIGGVVTYKKSGLDEVMKVIGLDKVVLETDAPYLSPVPFRGKRNEPSYIKHVAEKIAEALGIPVEEVAKITSANAELLFARY